MVLNGEQHFQPMRPSVPDREYARCCWTYQRHRGDAGTMVLIHQRAPPAKGDHPQNWRATDPSTSGHQPHNWSSRRYFLNLEFGGHVLEVSSTSHQLPFGLLDVVVQAMLLQYGFPLFAVRSTVSFVFFFIFLYGRKYDSR